MLEEDESAGFDLESLSDGRSDFAFGLSSIGAKVEAQGWVFARAIVGGQPSFDCLVAGAPYPLPLLVEVWVLGSVPGGTVLPLVIGLAAAVAVLTDLGGHRCRFGRLAALGLLTVPGQVRRARCPFVVPEVVLELDLLPLVDQLLADHQELIDGSFSLVVRVLC